MREQVVLMKGIEFFCFLCHSFCMKYAQQKQMITLEPRVSADLRKALAADAQAKIIWLDITPVARRDWISWIDSAKQPETRRRRIEQTCSKLVAGKRRPCCYAVVPFEVYKALDADLDAKREWKKLTPDARRDVIAWIDSAKNSDERKHKIAQACKLIAVRKRVNEILKK